MGEKEKGERDVIDLLKKLQDQISGLSSQNSQISHQITEIKSELQNFKTEIITKVDGLELENNSLKAEIKKLQIKNQLSEKRAIKYNIVVYGLATKKLKLTENVVEFFRDKLQITCEVGDIRDTYLFPQIGNNIIQPVLVELSRIALKSEILSNSKKLKGTGIFISPQYTPEDYKKRKFLVTKWKIAKEQHQNVKLKNNSLIIDGKPYSYEELAEIQEENTIDRAGKSNAKEDIIEKTHGKRRQLAGNPSHPNKTYSVNLRSKIK